MSAAIRVVALALAVSSLSSAFAADSIAFSNLYSFVLGGNVGLQPYGGPIVASDGKLYGITSSGTVVYSYTPGAAAPVNLHSLISAEGSQAYGQLIEPVPGTLVGETTFGGANSKGAIFSISTTTGAVTVLHSATAAEPNSFNGTPFYASDGFVYVVTAQSGLNAYGGIVRVALNATGFNVMHNNINTQGQPTDGVIEGADGRLYGVTSNGGTGLVGTVFAMKKDGTNYVILHHFVTTDGSSPKGGLLLASDGLLYGMTAIGGANNKGVIYRIAQDGTGFEKIYDFDGTKGSTPQGRLIEAKDGRLYGNAELGGDTDEGVVFRINKDGTVFQVLRSLTAAADGSRPYGSLAETPAGTFYGIAQGGGSAGFGALFRVTVTPQTASLPPVVKISGPKTRSTTSSRLTLKGTVTDPDGTIPHVQVKVGSLPYKNAKGVTKWTFVVKPKAGRNVVKVRGVDAGGAISPVQRVVINRLLPQ